PPIVFDDSPSQAAQLWDAYGMKSVWLAIAVGVAALGWRWMNRTFDETKRESDAMAQSFTAAADARTAQAAPSPQVEIGHAIERNSLDADERFTAAAAHFERREFTEAIAAFSNVMERYPKRPQAAKALLYRARAYLGNELLWDADRDVAAFLEKHPGSGDFPQALALGAEIAERLKMHERAVERATKLLTDHLSSPYVPTARLWRGIASAALGDTATARADLTSVLGSTGPADPIHERAKQALDELGPEPQAPAP
ncbi:MAG: outer membrane protein assembly factor BamD, partial [Archangium sp.]|nr:outer membrane protein assembly factor BamD [Archangium sp.]